MKWILIIHFGFSQTPVKDIPPFDNLTGCQLALMTIHESVRQHFACVAKGKET